MPLYKAACLVIQGKLLYFYFGFAVISMIVQSAFLSLA